RFMQSGGEKSIRPTDREVAILYFDIAQSTEAIGRLDMAAYQKAIDSLFKIVIRVLQKSDMTISNFSGDGGMAIANAPNAVANYRKTAIDAAFDILAAVADRQKEFEEEWGAEFAIRIGVASGSGRVGFFPNEGFGLYTALGEVVNLSERLCSSAPANSVALLRAELRSAGYGRAAAAAEPLFSASELKGLTSLEGVVVAVSASDARTLRGTTA
ncbi:MAG: adenylate/guanylate cyclase domain-containing protein, partial [Pseudomonadota bacterium]